MNLDEQFLALVFNLQYLRCPKNRLTFSYRRWNVKVYIRVFPYVFSFEWSMSEKKDVLVLPIYLLVQFLLILLWRLPKHFSFKLFWDLKFKMPVLYALRILLLFHRTHAHYYYISDHQSIKTTTTNTTTTAGYFWRPIADEVNALRKDVEEWG